MFADCEVLGGGRWVAGGIFCGYDEVADFRFEISMNAAWTYILEFGKVH